MQKSNGIYEPDLWLGKQLGCQAYHLRFDERNYPAGEVAGILDRCLKEPGIFVYTKLDVERLTLVHACQAAGFRTADVSVEMRLKNRHCLPALAGPTIRSARSEDRHVVGELAARSLRYSRFHQDPLIPQDRADTLKANWADNFFNGRRGDGMLVAEVNGEVAGFLLYLQLQTKKIIDLIAVDHSCRRINIGSALVKSLADQGDPSGLEVTTQAANAGALQFYQAIGFHVQKMTHVLHFHG